MERTAFARMSSGKLSAALAGFAWLAAAGCAEQADDVETIQSAITDGWTTLTLNKGWSNYNGTSNPPAIGKVNEIVTFRGALKSDGSGGDSPFTIPSQFLPVTGSVLALPVVMASASRGALSVETTGVVHAFRDGESPAGPGPAGKVFTSLDGVSYDRITTDAEPIQTQGNWIAEYPHRVGQGATAGVYAKLVNGFVRLQGEVHSALSSNTSLYLFNIPKPEWCPGQSVYVPVALCSGSTGAYGRLNIYSDCRVFVQPENNNVAAANCGVTVEGASYALSFTPTALPLENGWIAYSARAVKVRKDGGVVRFQGAVYNGTSTTITTKLPSTMWPPVTVYIPADAFGATHGRIVVTPTGTVRFDSPVLSTAKGFLSLDSVSFGL